MTNNKRVILPTVLLLILNRALARTACLKLFCIVVVVVESDIENSGKQSTSHIYSTTYWIKAEKGWLLCQELMCQMGFQILIFFQILIKKPSLLPAFFSKISLKVNAENMEMDSYR